MFSFEFCEIFTEHLWSTASIASYLIDQRKLKRKQRRRTFEWQWRKWEKENKGLKEKGSKIKKGDGSYRRTSNCETALDKGQEYS